MSNLYIFRSSIAGTRPPDALPCPANFHHRCSSTSRPARPQPLPLAAAIAATDVPTLSAGISNPCKQQIAEDRLPEFVRVSLYGANNSGPKCVYSSSGSSHGPSSICLSDMVNDFFENDGDEGQPDGICSCARCSCLDGACCDSQLGNSIGNEDEDDTTVQGHLSEVLQGVISGTESTELSLLVDVTKAMEEEERALSVLGVFTTATSFRFSEAGERATVSSSSLIRLVTRRLQQAGYNAAICKSRWNHGDGLPAGDYDYIDVLLEGQHGKQDRIIVDIDFKEQFEIARASENYRKLLNFLPRVFVGKGERLQKILKIMSNGTKRSLKKQGLHLPPWRKQRYMHAKWFSSYRRTTSLQESSRKQKVLSVDEDILPGFRIGIRGPRFSTEFTKVMDMAFFRAQAKAIQQNRRIMEKSQEDLVLLNAKMGDEVPDMSKQKGAKRVILNESQRLATATEQQYPQRRMEHVCTVIFTDWQLPALREKTCANRPRDRVSGLAAVLKQEVLARAAAPAS